MDIQRGQVGAAAVLGLGIIIAALVASLTFYNVRALDNTLSVTGSATQDVKADAAKWTVSINRSAYESDVPSTQARVSRDTQTVVDFFSKGGIAAKDILVTPVSVDQDYSSDANAPRRYSVHEQITVSSDDPSQIDELAKDIGSLAGKGILVSAGQPEYYVTTLPQIRVALIGKAVEDAKARAVSVVSSTGQKVGALKSASSGVVQVMAPSSVDVSDYGSYDTSTIEKTVMVTARATFFLK
jgi:hypothetical protein